MPAARCKSLGKFSLKNVPNWKDPANFSVFHKDCPGIYHLTAPFYLRTEKTAPSLRNTRAPYCGCSLICFYYLSKASNTVILGAVEYFFACPYCSEQISMVLDTSVARQTYIEDCEVCCRPIEVRYTVEEDEVSDFEATAT